MCGDSSEPIDILFTHSLIESILIEQDADDTPAHVLEFIDVPIEDDGNDVDNDDDEDDTEYANDADGNDLQPHSLSHLQLDTFPAKLIDDTRLILKGAELNDLISRFYLLDCDYCSNDG